MGRRVGDSSSTCFRSSCAAIWVGPNSNGASLRVSCTSGLARREKFCMKIRHTPMVPRNVQMLERVLHGPQFAILSTLDVSGSRPCGVQQCLTAMISSVHSKDLNPLNVPPQKQTRWTTQLRP